MGNSTFGRLASYYQRHGVSSTFKRAYVAGKRAVFANRMIIFSCDLATQDMARTEIPDALKVERLTMYAELSQSDFQEMTSFWNPELAHERIKERFQRGASLWLIRLSDKLAGYCWTLRGHAIGEYYFPVMLDDVQLFDVHVFPRFRGRGVLWFLITILLQSLKGEGVSHVFADVAEWNDAALSLYKPLPFRRVGLARKFKLFGRTMVLWDDSDTGKPSGTSQATTPAPAPPQSRQQ